MTPEPGPGAGRRPRRWPSAAWAWLDRFPWPLLLPLAVWMAMAPFTPEPHLVEKLRLLLQGRLSRPVDMFDLALHMAPLCLVALKLWRQRRAQRRRADGAE